MVVLHEVELLIFANAVLIYSAYINLITKKKRMTCMTQDFPHLPYRVPSRGTAWNQSVFKRLFLAQGWRFTGEFPNFPKAMAIVSPHTSNLDAWYAFLALLGLGIRVTVFGKNTLFKTPLKPLLDWIGVIPVERQHASGLTQQIVEIIQAQEKIWIAMAPEGTRKCADKIRSGFYYIAHEAQIPIVMFAFDYENKAIRCLGAFHTTGDFEHDLAEILQRYEGHFSPKNPDWLAKPLQKHWKKP